jgi:hypothetical protein
VATNSNRPPPTSDPATVSLVRGGPFYRAQQSVRLIRPNKWNLVRRITFIVAVGWFPLVVITALLNPETLVSLLRDYRVHSRMLIAVPILLAGELLMESRFSVVLAHVRKAGLLESADIAYLDDVVAKLMRVRDSFLPELAILLLLIVHTATSYTGLIDATPWLAHGTAPDLHLTAAGWYGVWVSATIFQFLLGLALWKWLLWTFLAFKLSRCNLKLVATHPDEHGGIGFLGLSAAAFTPVAFAVTTVIGGTWRQEILHHGAHLMNFRLPAIILVAIIALIALGPLVFFVPRLVVLRRKGILEYGILGQLHSADFHEKWILHRAGQEDEFLQAPEISALADYGNAYEKIEQLKPFPADKGTLYGLAAAVVIPALPVILAEVPLAVVLQDLLKALR